MSRRNRTRKRSCTQTPTPDALHKELDEIIDKVRYVQSLTGMVTLVMVALRCLGLKIIRMVLEQRDEHIHRTRKEAPCCSRCGHRMHKPRRKPVTRGTLLGWLRYQRRSWLCKRCHKGYSPLDATLGLVILHHGHSLEFVKKLTLMCVLHAFGRGCQLFKECFGFDVSTHLAYPLVEGIGRHLCDEETRRAEQLWKLRFSNPEMFEPTPAQLRQMKRCRRKYVMMDNCKARIQEGKRGRGAKKRKKRTGIVERFNLKVTKPVPVIEEDLDKKTGGNEDWRDVRAVLAYDDKDVAQCSKKRRVMLRRRILAHVGTKEEFKKLLHMFFYDEGIYVAHEVVVVADGGNGIWELVEELLPTTSSRKVVEILDWCHAVSHLWTVAKKWKPGNKTTAVKARGRWVEGLVKYLAEGKVSNVLQRLKRLQRGKKGKLFEEIRKCLDYLRKHRNRMKYGQYRKQGLTIGSGAIESVHKWVIQARCKQPGMAWSQNGLNAMLRLRCAWASDRWDDVFKQTAFPAAEKLNVVDAAA